MSRICLEDKILLLLTLRQELAVTLRSLKNWLDLLAANEVLSFCDDFGHVANWALDFRQSLEATYGFEWTRVSLEEWLAHVHVYQIGDESLERWFNVSDRCVQCSIWESKQLTHWFSAIRPLIEWWSLEPAQLVSVKWRRSPKYVQIFMRGYSKLARISEKRYTGREDFWSLDVELGKTMIPLNALKVELLLSQLLARQGGGSLNVNVSEKNQILMILEIPRAEMFSQSELGESMVSQQAAACVLKRALWMLSEAWLDMGNQLLQMIAVKPNQKLKCAAANSYPKVTEGIKKASHQLSIFLITLEKEMSCIEFSDV